MPSRTPFPCRFFIFDLDGTLIASRRDIALSLNLAFQRLRLPAIPLARIAEFVGEGVRKLVERALREVTRQEPSEPLIEQAAAAFYEEYGIHLLDSTHLVEGTYELLDSLKWGTFAIVTNKPEDFSVRILEGLGIADRFQVIFGGDSLPQRKPDPAPLIAAMERCRADRSETAMIGDSAIDILAGKAAGVVTCGVAAGFRGRGELERAGCDVVADHLFELRRLFREP
jgi:phosphoglycolate phosphatase